MRKKNWDMMRLKKTACLVGMGTILTACAPGGQEIKETGLTEEETQQEQTGGAALEEEAAQEQTGEAAPEEETTQETEEQEPEATETEETTDTSMIADAAENGESVQAGGYLIQPMIVERRMMSEDQEDVYVTVSAQYPKVSNEANPRAAEKINVVIEDEVMARLSLTEYEEWAKEDYEWRVSFAEEQGQTFSWQPYSAEMSYSLERADGKIISFLFRSYDYIGGAHGGQALYGMTFDAQTGEKLTLETLGESEQAIRDEAEPILMQQADEMQEAFERGERDMGLFEEYADYMPDVLTQESWYLTKDGMGVVANEYLIAPYSTGPITFHIPYEQCTFIKEAYLP